jgi:uncharacterized protein (TIGR00369 family)
MNFCFGCGKENPIGLHLHFDVQSSASGEVTTTADVEMAGEFQGPPGLTHGGIIATLLDESMAKLNAALGLLAMTRRMEIDYLKPVPIRTRLTVRARHVKREGRKLFHYAEIADADGIVLARATALFIVVPATSQAHLAP